MDGHQAYVLSVLKEVGAVLTGHFVYTSWRHGRIYLNKDALYPDTDKTSGLCSLVAAQHQGRDIEVVVAPALGGIALAQWVTHHLRQLTGRKILAIYTEKDKDDNQILRRGYDLLVKGRRVLVVDDLTTTSGSVKKVIETVQACDGTVIAVAVLINRDPEKVTLESVGVPFFPLTTLQLESWSEEECPPCKEGVPINIEVGHGREFLEKRRQRE